MNQKYEFTGKTTSLMSIDSQTAVVEHTHLHQIRALRDIDNPLLLTHSVEAGDVGGWVESIDNLSDQDESWIHTDGMVYGSSVVSINGVVLSGRVNNTEVLDHSVVNVSATNAISDSELSERATISGASSVKGTAVKGGTIRDSIVKDSWVLGYAVVENNSNISNSSISDRALLQSVKMINGVSAHIMGNAILRNVVISTDGANGANLIKDNVNLSNAVVSDVYLAGSFQASGHGNKPVMIQKFRIHDGSLRGGMIRGTPKFWIQFNSSFSDNVITITFDDQGNPMSGSINTDWYDKFHDMRSELKLLGGIILDDAVDQILKLPRVGWFV